MLLGAGEGVTAEAEEVEETVVQELASAELMQEIIMHLLLPLKILDTSPPWVLNEILLLHFSPFGDYVISTYKCGLLSTGTR